MKMKIYGFSWVPTDLPKLVPAAMVFERLRETAGTPFGNYIGAATLIGEWWAGVLLKVRDSRAVTMLKEQNGVLVFSAERLAEGTSVAEPNFFIAHTSNGHGLYYHHHLSASLIGDFAYFCHHRFREIREARFVTATEHEDMTDAEKRRVKQQYKGKLVLEQILKPGSFDAHVRSLRSVTKLEANLVAFELTQSLFRPITQNARHQDQRLTKEASAKPTAFYGPLRNLGTALLANVILALLSSMLKVTLGFVNSPWSIAVCLGFAAVTLFLLVYLWWEIARNLFRWFDMIERKKRKKLGR